MGIISLGYETAERCRIKNYLLQTSEPESISQSGTRLSVRTRLSWRVKTELSGADHSLALCNSSPIGNPLAGGTESSTITVAFSGSDSTCDSLAAISEVGGSLGRDEAGQEDVDVDEAGGEDWLIYSMIVGKGWLVEDFKLQNGIWNTTACIARDISSFHQVKFNSNMVQPWRRLNRERKRKDRLYLNEGFRGTETNSDCRRHRIREVHRTGHKQLYRTVGQNSRWRARDLVGSISVRSKDEGRKQGEAYLSQFTSGPKLPIL